MTGIELVESGAPLPRIESFKILERRKIQVQWQSGERHVVDLSPALLSHRLFVRLRNDDELFQTALKDEFGDVIFWSDGSELSAAWIYNLAEPDMLSNEEFRLAMDSLHMSLDGMAARLGIARRLIAEYRKDRALPRAVSLATRYLVERSKKLD